MGMIHKINLMGVPLQVEDLLFNIDRKKQRKRECFTCGEKGYFRDNWPNMAEPKNGRSKGNALTSVKTWDVSSSEDEPPRKRSHRSSSRSSRSSHKYLMCNALNLGVEFFLLFSHQIRALLSFLFLFRSFFPISNQYSDRCPCHV
jgi:hypothetical protein